MATIAVTSAKGAPGVSTACLALALTWPRPVLLVDADPAGGDLLAGFYNGAQPAGRGVLGATLEARRTPMRTGVWSQVLPLSEGRPTWLLPGVSSPRQVRSVDWVQLAAALPDVEHDGQLVDTLVDVGRLRPASEATNPDAPGPETLLRAADVVVLLTAGNLPAVRAAQLRVEQLQAMLTAGLGGVGRLVCVLAAGRGPYGSGEIARELDVPVAATLPQDAKTAATLMAGAPARRGWRHAPLMRAAASTAGLLDEIAAARRVQAAPSPAHPRGGRAVPPTAVILGSPATALTPTPTPAELVAIPEAPVTAPQGRRGWEALPAAPSRAGGGRS